MRRITVFILVVLLWAGIVYAAIQAVTVVPMTYKILATAVTVDTSEDALPATAMVGRQTVCIFNNDATAQLFIGATGLSTTSGFPVQPKTAITIDADDSVVIYGIAASSINVRVLECK